MCLINDEQSMMANQQWSGEVVHWLKCMDFSQKCKNSMVRTGKGFLHVLGDEILFTSIVSDEFGDFSSFENT